MASRRDFLRTGSLGLAAITLSNTLVAQQASVLGLSVTDYVSKRPEMSKRNFTSKAVEEKIKQVKKKIKYPKLAWLFENCYPNTLDTTVEYGTRNNKPDTFVITGDIKAMWLRDSSAQVFPYLPLAVKDAALSSMIEGVIRRQSYCINIDPYANAFNKEATGSEWKTDHTTMTPMLHERKWEIDSLCYPVRLAYHYWKTTGNTAVFDEEWQQAAHKIYATFVQQQRKKGTKDTPYTFTRQTDRQADTVLNNGYGSPINPVGLICSSFRPSDDATLFSFLIPANLFAVESLRQLAEIFEVVLKNITFAQECRALSDEVFAAVQGYGIADHPKYGKVYAYEVDGFGGHVFMDDSNVPNLLALPYLCSFITTEDKVYQNTRKLVLSADNPYYFSGKAASGVGGPHVGFDYIWPMSLIIQVLTTQDVVEIKRCLDMLVATDAGTGFMHESFHKDNPDDFTRSWFAWANTLFGELVVKIADKHPELLA